MSEFLFNQRANKSVTPYHFEYPNGTQEYQTGLTLREYYAGLAMQGILAGRNNFGASKIIKSQVAKQAITFADDLIKELNNAETTQPG